jgi:hypothetical protein
LPTLRGLETLNRGGRNIYVGVASRTAKGKSGNKAFARCLVLVADFDGMSLADALERITRAGLPPPTMVISSGHGAHAYWRLSEPIQDGEVWRRWQRSLAALLKSDTTMDDPDQMIRLPGFQNTKSKPYIACEIVAADDSLVYDLADLGRFIPLVKDSERKAPAPPIGATATAGGRHAMLTSLGGTMRRRGMDAAEIDAALQAVNQRRCDPPLDAAEVTRIAECMANYKPAQIVGVPNVRFRR